MKKLYVTFEEVHKLVKKIAEDIINDNWEPDCIVGIAAGGFMPARILRNFIKKDIYVVGLKRYTDENEAHAVPIKIQWIDGIENKLKGKKILLVDEIDDTRITLSYCLNELLKSKPSEIRIAVLHQKAKNKKAKFPDKIKKIYQGSIVPDVWIKYPWDALDIDEHNKMCNSKDLS
jgi:uncharacterized protein